MGKDKKQKKNQEKNLPDEPDSTDIISTVAQSSDVKEDRKTNKRGKSQNVPSVPVAAADSGDSDIEIVTLEQQGKSRSKSKKKAFKGGFDLLTIEGNDSDEIQDDNDNNTTQAERKTSKSKKKASKGGFDLLTIEGNDSDEIQDDNDDNTTRVERKSSKSKKKASKGGFDLLTIEGNDADEIQDDVDDSTTQAERKSSKDETVDEVVEKPEGKATKKSKKKERRKKKEEDDDELDKLLEELTLEMTGGKPAEKPKVDQPDVAVTEVKTEETTEKVGKKKKKKLKEESQPEVVESKEESPAPDVVDEEASTVKTAAQKKKEKKEREKLKKAAEHEKLASKKKAAPEVSKPAIIPKVEDGGTEDLAEKNEEDKADDKVDIDDADDVSDKKKKKKKGVEEDKKKDKKRPGNKQLAAMQEALRKVKEEEERLRQEEEARIAAAEEAERLKEEKLQLEKEKKERRKLKEKERRDRLRAEGKLLSKAQRHDRARMEVTLEALRQQGVDIPKIGEKREKVVRLGDRKRGPKKRTSIPEETAAPTIEPEVEVQVADTEEVKASISDEEEDNTKEAWYDTSSEEDEAPTPAVGASSDSATKDKKPSNQSEESSDSEDESSGDEEETSSSDSEDQATPIEIVRQRIKQRRELAEEKKSLDKLRSPVVCVLGHVDTGKTKILDKIRSTHVQDGEAGGITQQIGATMVPQEALKDQCKMVKNFNEMELKVPGLLIIDTPGHESFSNLRSRGSSLCDIAILVVDITHGLEPQTIESINLLKQKKTPFVVALNKIDRIYEWKPMKHKDVHDVIKNQSRSTKQFFEDRVKQVILEFANQALNAVLYYENKDPRTYISMVPTSALTGDGMGNIMSLIIEFTQSMMAKRLQFSEDLQATVLEVKAIGGLGHTMDVILVNGRLREGDTIVFAGYEGPMTAQIRSLLMPQPLKELRVKTQFIEHRTIEGAQGIKITGKELEKAIAGLPLLVPCRSDEIPILKEEIAAVFKETINAIKVTNVGVYVQASTLGSLEALMEFLTASKIPVCGVRIGPVTKRDVMKTSVMLEHGPLYAVILAFDVKIEKEAQDLADFSNIKIFHANIIYHLFDMYTEYAKNLKEKDKEQFKNEAIFPCKLRILPQFIFNSRDPIVVGVSVEAGCVKHGTPLCVPSKECLEIGIVTTIESNHKALDCARKGQEICIKIEPAGGDTPKMFGRHFDHTDLLVSKISRNSIDMCKKYFRDELQKSDWQLMLELKSTFAIL